MSRRLSSANDSDDATQPPFLLRIFWRNTRSISPEEFSIVPPADDRGIDHYSLLPRSIRGQSVDVYTWPNQTLAELTALLTGGLASVLPDPAVGTRLVYKLVFPDTRARISENGRGRWLDRPLGSVVIGQDDVSDEGENGRQLNAKTLADARLVIGDYIACSIHPPDAEGKVAPDPMLDTRPRARENGHGPRNGYRGGRGLSGPPRGDWRRGERPPGDAYGYGRGRPY